ncbi:WAS/WASL-interacting protein family member 1 [Muntiacus reevesi]|uniref:WAS/WASL-interacting protein family member 1 n=1 Tax=Muntiacus reevesi TaxID=9886 RepID=UPI0033076BF6
MPVPPPPAPPPPPTFALANTEKPSLSKSEQAGRNALLSDISKGKKLKKTVTNDRSAPILDKPKGAAGGGGGGGGSYGGGGGGGGGSFGGGGPPGLGGLFQAGMPKLRSTANRENESGGSRPPVLPPGGRATSAKPFTPPSGAGRFPVPPAGHRSGPPELQRNRMPPPRPEVGAKPDNLPPPVPNTPRPSQSSLHNRGSPLVPGAPRQPSPGLTPPPFPGNRGAAFGGGSIRQTPSGSSTPFSNRPPLPPTPSRALDDKPPPPPPPVGNRPAIHREPVPPPPPQNSKPPVPSAPRPSSSSQAPPPPPPSRPGPPPLPPVSTGSGDEIPRLPQRNVSLSSSSAPPLPSPGRSGPLPPPPNERPPPPVRDPPGRSGPLPPPPPMNRNGSTSRALPATPQLPSRSGIDSSPRSGPRPPLPPERPGTGAPPPPPPSTSIRNGFQDSSCEDEWESRFYFHPISDLPPPEPYVPTTKSYPSKLARNESRSGSNRRERGAPPLPPIPR